MDSRAFCPAGGWAESSRGGWGRAGLGLGGRSERAGAQRDPETGLRARGWSRSGFAIPLGAGGPEPLPEEQKEKKREGGDGEPGGEVVEIACEGLALPLGKAGVVWCCSWAPRRPRCCAGGPPRVGDVPGTPPPPPSPARSPLPKAVPGLSRSRGRGQLGQRGCQQLGGGLRRGAGGGQGLPDALDCGSDVGNRLPSSLACD